MSEEKAPNVSYCVGIDPATPEDPAAWLGEGHDTTEEPPFPFEPLHDRVLLRVLDNKKVTPGGLHLPESQRAPNQREAVVLAVGDGVYVDGWLISPAVEVGETVIVTKYGGEDIEIVGEKLLIVRDSDILGVLRGDP